MFNLKALLCLRTAFQSSCECLNYFLNKDLRFKNATVNGILLDKWPDPEKQSKLDKNWKIQTSFFDWHIVYYNSMQADTDFTSQQKLHLPPPLKTQSHQSAAVNICYLLKDTGQYLLRINMFYIKNKSAWVCTQACLHWSKYVWMHKMTKTCCVKKKKHTHTHIWRNVHR